MTNPSTAVTPFVDHFTGLTSTTKRFHGALAATCLYNKLRYGRAFPYAPTAAAKADVEKIVLGVVGLLVVMFVYSGYSREGFSKGAPAGMKQRRTYRSARAIELEEAHPDADVVNLRFTDLWKWVQELPDFADDPGRSNEKILEAIQAAWIEERD